MESSLRHRLAPIVGIVTLAIGLGFVFSIRAVSRMFEPVSVLRTEVDDEARTHDKIAVPQAEPWSPLRHTELSCYDPHILSVWQELKRDARFRAWTGSFAGRLDCSELLDVRNVDLNRDGKGEFLVRGKVPPLCDADGNCGFWIFEQRDRRTIRLLYDPDHSIDFSELGDQILPSRAKGYSKILVKYRHTNGETSYTTYSFDGQRYVASNCMFEVAVRERGSGESWEMITCTEWRRRLDRRSESD